MSESAMSWYYSVTLVNVKAILHSAAIVKIIFHLHRSNNSARYTLYFVPPSTERHMHFADRYLSHVPPPQVRLPELCSTALNGYRTSSVIRTLYWSCSQAPGKTFQFARYKRSEPITCSLGGSRNDRNKPKFHLARHVSTRHDTFDVSSPWILAVSSLSNSTAWHTRHNKRDSQLSLLCNLY